MPFPTHEFFFPFFFSDPPHEAPQTATLCPISQLLSSKEVHQSHFVHYSLPLHGLFPIAPDNASLSVGYGVAPPSPQLSSVPISQRFSFFFGFFFFVPPLSLYFSSAFFSPVPLLIPLVRNLNFSLRRSGEVSLWVGFEQAIFFPSH